MRYRLGVSTPAGAAGAAYAQLRTSASNAATVWEIHFSVTAATASSVGLIRAATVGTNSTTQLGQAENTSSQAALSNIDTAWSTAPTISTAYLDKITVAATIGAGWVWTFPTGILVPASSGLLLWNFGSAAGSILAATFVWDE